MRRLRKIYIVSIIFLVPPQNGGIKKGEPFEPPSKQTTVILLLRLLVLQFVFFVLQSNQEYLV